MDALALIKGERKYALGMDALVCVLISGFVMDALVIAFVKR